MALPIITQSEMVAELEERTGWSKSDVKTFLSHLDDFIRDQVSEGYRVKVVPGLVVGPVVAAARKARMGRNPATGEEVKIPKKPASVKLKAKVGKPLNEVELPSVAKLQRMG